MINSTQQNTEFVMFLIVWAYKASALVWYFKFLSLEMIQVSLIFDLLLFA